MLFWAACSLAFFGFLRGREFTCSGPFDPVSTFSLSHLWFAPSGSIRLLITSSNTDPFSQRRPSLYWSFEQFPLSCVCPPSLPSASWLCPWAAVRLFELLFSLLIPGQLVAPLLQSQSSLLQSQLPYWCHHIRGRLREFQLTFSQLLVAGLLTLLFVLRLTYCRPSPRSSRNVELFWRMGSSAFEPLSPASLECCSLERYVLGTREQQ